MTLEFHAWPPRRGGGQQVTRTTYGVLALDTETGVAVLVTSERSQYSNQQLAGERVKAILGGVAHPGEWTR